jgi:hypothetical protein
MALEEGTSKSMITERLTLCSVDTKYGPCGAIIRIVDESETGKSLACMSGHGWYTSVAWGSTPARVVRDDSIAREAFGGGE